MEWRDILLSVIFGLWSVIVYRAGARSVVKKVEKTSFKKVRRPTYNAGDLLDPISPRDQRLERKLESKTDTEIEE